MALNGRASLAALRVAAVRCQCSRQNRPRMLRLRSSRSLPAHKSQARPLRYARRGPHCSTSRTWHVNTQAATPASAPRRRREHRAAERAAAPTRRDRQAARGRGRPRQHRSRLRPGRCRHAAMCRRRRCPSWATSRMQAWPAALCSAAPAAALPACRRSEHVQRGCGLRHVSLVDTARSHAWQRRLPGVWHKTLSRHGYGRCSARLRALVRAQSRSARLARRTATQRRQAAPHGGQAGHRRQRRVRGDGG